MLNQLGRIILIFTACLALLACHKPPILDTNLALSVLNSPDKLSGYAVSIVTNNPNAHGENARGWTCSDKQVLADTNLAECKTAGRSGVYLKFTDEGKKLLIGKPWGDANLRNARVIAVKQQVQTIDAINMSSKTHAIVDYTSAYTEHTPFSNTHLKKLLILGVPQKKQAEFILTDKEWVLN
jgi:hypothetical protein